MGYKARYDKGDWVAICDSCGRKFKASHLKRRWDGLMTCSEDWEPRQTQDYVRGKAEKQIPVWTRSEASNTFADGESHTQSTYTNPNLTPVTVTLTALSSPTTTMTGYLPANFSITSTGSHLYTCNLTTISQFDINTTTGVLTAKSPETVNGLPATQMAAGRLTRDDKHYYAASNSAVVQYGRNLTTGVLSLLSPDSVTFGSYTTTEPRDIIISPNDLFCYVSTTTEDGAKILRYSRNPTTGQLTYLASTSIPYSVLDYGLLSMSSTGDFLYLACVSHGEIFQFSVNTTTGDLTPLTPAYIVLSDLGITPGLVGDMVISPDNKFLYISGTPGPGVTKLYIEVYYINSDGTLTPLPQLFLPIEFSPGDETLSISSLVISQDGTFFSYLERRAFGIEAGVSKLYQCSRNRLTGALTRLTPESITMPPPIVFSLLSPLGISYNISLQEEVDSSIYSLSLAQAVTEDLLSTDEISEVDASLGSFTINLPSSPTTGETHIIKKVDTTNNIVTIYGNGNLINGYPVFELTKPYSGVCLEFTTTWTIKYTYPA